VCPLSVLANWKSEITRFAPTMKVLQFKGDKSNRDSAKEKIKQVVMSQPKSVRKDPKHCFNVMITSFETMRSEIDFLSKFRWRCLIIDEAQRLKNSASATFGEASRLFVTQPKEGGGDGLRILLTGTPVQNNVAELWSLLSFANPSIFPLALQGDFQDWFGTCGGGDGSDGADTGEGDTGKALLQQAQRPFLLRRTKVQSIIAQSIHLFIAQSINTSSYYGARRRLLAA
jgi:ATP-dependent DNA helicase